MKKIVLLALPIIILTTVCRAQIKWSDYSQSYVSGSTDKVSDIGIITAIRSYNDAFWNGSNDALETALKSDTAFQHSRPQRFVARNSYDTSKAQFFLHGVNNGNASLYEYRVTDTRLKTNGQWIPIAQFTDQAVIKASTMPQMAYLGGYVTDLGHEIIVDVRKRSTAKIIAAAVVRWKPIKPQIDDIYTPNELNIFLSRLARPWQHPPEDKNYSRWKKLYPLNLDPLTSLPKKLVLAPNTSSLIFYLESDVSKKELIEYQLTRNNEVVRTWRANDFDNRFVWLNNLKYGDYVLNIRYSMQPQNVTSYSFLISTPWYESLIFRIILFILSGSLIGFVIFLVLHYRQKKKTEQEQTKRARLQLELKSIYAQLNPHFVFNSLSSIQGLINKQDIKGANNYLSDFARLMRDSLNNTNKEYIPLKQEMELLETYLKLEQLRFGFEYKIRADENINLYETEIPSLLLQPLIENAIKHGISGLHDNGVITIEFLRKSGNMIISIIDNGAGFKPDSNSEGFGLKLTNDRIMLLNALTKDQSVTMEIKGNLPSGTIINLTFKNWFI